MYWYRKTHRIHGLKKNKVQDSAHAVTFSLRKGRKWKCVFVFDFISIKKHRKEYNRQQGGM